MQAIIDACRHGCLDATPCVVVSNNSESMALQRARAAGIPGYHISAVTHPGAEEDREILRVLRRHGVDTVVLAGYMKQIGPETLTAYRGRMLNIHPALLPKFGGRGMYGRRVHEAVLNAGERTTGVSVHLVDDLYDHGRVLAQCEVPVREGDTRAKGVGRVRQFDRHRRRYRKRKRPHVRLEPRRR